MTMATKSYKERHAEAMLSPEGVDETLLVEGFTFLTKLADRYKDDGVMLAVVEQTGSALIRLAGDGNNGRLDGGTYCKQVTDTVERAGGDTSEL